MHSRLKDVGQRAGVHEQPFRELERDNLRLGAAQAPHRLVYLQEQSTKPETMASAA